MSRHRALLESDLLAERFAIFPDAERVIADPVVRNRGTIGGALCQADPAEDLSAVCAAVDAQMVIRGPQGERVLGMQAFHRGPYRTAVGPAEMLVEIRVPVAEGSGSAYEKLDRRTGDWAVAAAGAAVTLADGVITHARVALAAVGSDVRCVDAEAILPGEPPSDELFRRAGAAGGGRLRAGDRPARLRRVQATRRGGPNRTLSLRRAAERANRGSGVMQVTVSVNDRDYTRQIEPRLLLVHFLRDELRAHRDALGVRHLELRHLRGPDGRRGPSSRARCWQRPPPVTRSETVEGLERDGILDPVQRGVHRGSTGSSAGLCTPGMMMTARALLDRNPDPTDTRDPRGDPSGQNLPMHRLHHDRSLGPPPGGRAPPTGGRET